MSIARVCEILNRFRRSLSFRLSCLYITDTPTLLSIPVFHQLTHLEILEEWILWVEPLDIDKLAQLTHVSLYLNIQKAVPQYIRNLLINCSALKALILRVDHLENAKGWLAASNVIDHRIVVTDLNHKEKWKIVEAASSLRI